MLDYISCLIYLLASLSDPLPVVSSCGCWWWSGEESSDPYAVELPDGLEESEYTQEDPTVGDQVYQ